MTPQLDTKLVTSFLLFIDHEIQRQGSAFSNKSGYFYPARNKVANSYTYTCSYKQLCNDTSISGANIMSGVYLNGSYVSVGQSGLTSINHYDGSVTFSQQLPAQTVISGNFAVKEFSIYLSDEPDYKVLLDTKFRSNPKFAQQATGMALDEKSMPAVILVVKEQEARPLAFAGIDDNYMAIRAMVVCENVYQRISVCNILKNFRLKNIKLVSSSPLDYLGNMTGANYNYDNLSGYDFYAPFIQSAKTVNIPQQGDYDDIVRHFAMADFDISTWGGHQ